MRHEKSRNGSKTRKKLRLTSIFSNDLKKIENSARGNVRDFGPIQGSLLLEAIFENWFLAGMPRLLFRRQGQIEQLSEETPMLAASATN